MNKNEKKKRSEPSSEVLPASCHYIWQKMYLRFYVEMSEDNYIWRKIEDWLKEWSCFL